MKLLRYLFISCFFILNACSEKNDDLKHQHLGTLKAFAEMVAADVKPIALSEPLSTNEVDDLWAEALAIAKKYQVEIYREKDLVKTILFPEALTAGKEVLILHKKETLDAYLNLKKSIHSSANEQEAARSFGRLLGYPNHYINKLLAENTSFRTLNDFGIEGTNLFLYYKDLDKARIFYNETLGLEILSDYGFAVTLKISKDAWVTLVDAEIGRHKADEPKTVAIALLTNHLAEWYAYLQDKKVPIKYEYKPKENNPHDGFVAIDPEGYLLEFEMFKPHPENEKLIPKLPKYDATSSDTGKWNIKEGFYGTVTWLYYQDMQESEKFYEETIGLKQIVDQGWAKVYQVSETGYIGLVDERRGMHNFTEKKGTSVSFLLKDLEGWYEYVKINEPLPIIKEMYSGKEERYKAFVGMDPGMYFLEFNRFLPHPDNDKLLQSMKK
ncbi:Predicted ring-cleavage extradiol dioxygenase [Aquiflexum balticum DSM 16537]|uniref:Predicted ring-cleavage extradiol dioxygenase n=1 Tax=Aquiflexum balticum DSM 16537 TaxID=758820 RepID=A0A1W2H129_9BACT|nr:VOC family protein [Aquiflexum balticum]SMD42645.1 Predicted ring-cleavage extradiol dioxygenase [Aquiflexum balticum DSM 16537]